jgi:outer membrane immunogenic protein
VKKMLLAGTALFALASGAAMAADLSPAPAYSKAPMVPAFSWSGFYLGGDGGYGYANSGGTLATFAGVPQAPYGFNAPGPIAGGFVGGNYQMGALVLGAEADWQWANLSRSSPTVAGGVFGPVVMATTVKSYGSARGRVGFAVDHWLIFGTAGWAWGTWSTTYAALFTNSVSSHSGWTAGAGFEYAFTNALLARVEYRYTDLGTFASASPASGASELGNKVTINDIRAGLEYKFGGGY